MDHFRPIYPSSSHSSSQANLSVRHRRESEAATPLWSPKCACGMKQNLGVYNWNVSLEMVLVESDWAPFRYTIYGILSGSLVDSFWFLAACDRIENDSYCSFWFTFQVATVCAARRCQNQTASDRAAQSVADMGPICSCCLCMAVAMRIWRMLDTHFKQRLSESHGQGEELVVCDGGEVLCSTFLRWCAVMIKFMPIVSCRIWCACVDAAVRANRNMWDFDFGRLHD